MAADEGAWLKISEAVAYMLPIKISAMTLRRMADSNQIRNVRQPGTRADRQLWSPDLDALKARMLRKAFGDNPPGATEAMQERVENSTVYNAEEKDQLGGLFRAPPEN